MADLKQILLTIQSGGLHHVLEIVRYTLLKNRLDRLYQYNGFHRPALLPGNLVKASQQSAGGSFDFDHSQLELKFLAPEVVRVTWHPGSTPPPYALVWDQQPEPQISFQQHVQDVTLSSSRLQVVIKPDGSIHFLDQQGGLLRQELPPCREGEAWTSRFLPVPDEILHGLGLHSGPFDLRSRPHKLWACDAGGNYEAGHDPLYMPLPAYIGLHSHGCYLIFFENPNQGCFTPDTQLKDRQEIELSFTGGMLRYYFIAGSPSSILERFTALTGRAPLPPLWSLGFHQSRWGYKDEAEIRSVASGFQQHELPISAIHLDLDHLDNGRAFSFHPQRFPDVPALTHALAQQGIHLVTILDPGVKLDPQFDLYKTGMDQHAFCCLPDGNPLTGVLWLGRCHYPDFTDPRVRTWWGSFYPRLADLGVRGFWHDMNEPTSFVAAGEHSLPLATQHAMDGSPADHRQARNLYGFQMNRSGYEALRNYYPQQRPWILSRSGWVGSQRYAWAWTADSSTRWESMHMNLISVLSLGLCGFAFSGPDIGGFSGNPTPELFVRWFQMAAFMPLFRTHSSIGMSPREPWVFGEPYTSILRSYLNLRYQLLPYFYTLAWEHTQNGAPIVRPLFWEDWRDSRLWNIDDAFLLGDSLLVAPIFNPGIDQRSIMLPSGKWYDFWSDAAFPSENLPAGPIRLDAPLEHIPLLVRAGTVLPMREGDPISFAAKQDSAILSLHLYPPEFSQIGSGRIYSDDGDGYGSSRIDSFTLAWDAGRLILDWQSQGDYPFPYTATALHLHGYSIKQAWIDGEQQSGSALLTIQRQFKRVLIEVR